MSDDSDRLKYQVEFSQAVIRNLMLINGGAIVALFTFMGNTDATFDQDGILNAFACFTAGLIGAVLAAICGYFAHGSSRLSKTGSAKAWELIGVLVVAVSLVAFIGGSLLAISAVSLP